MSSIIDHDDNKVQYDIFPPLSPDDTLTKSDELSSLNQDQEIKANGNKDINKTNNSLSSSELISNELIGKMIHSQKRKHKRTDKEIEALSSFFNRSKLMHQLKEENTNPDDIIAIRTKWSEIIQLNQLKQGDLLFHINDIDDYCYFIIKGKFEALKQKEKQIPMTMDNYISYLMHLHFLREEYFLHTVLELNYSRLNIKLGELDRIATYYIKDKIRQMNNLHLLDLDKLKEIVSHYHKDFRDFNVDESEIEAKYNSSLLKAKGHSLWTKYLHQLFELSHDEKLFYERTLYLHDIELSSIDTFTIMIYEKFLLFYPGELFGYFSFELKENRIVMIRAEQDSVVGYLKKDDYMALISPQQKYISFLLESFFFSSISQIAFSKNFFHFFLLNDLGSKSMMHKQNSNVTSLSFILKGEIKVTSIYSIVDIHNITKQIIDKLVQLRPSEVTEFQLKEMKAKYLDDREIIKMTTKMGKENKFTIDMTKKQVLKLYSLGENDIVGIEEVFLGINYLSSFESGTEGVRCYSIDIENVKKILSKERGCIRPYTQVALNKITNYLLRLNEIKRSLIEYSRYKNRNKETSMENIFNISSNNNDTNYIQTNRISCLGGLLMNYSLVNTKSIPKKLCNTTMLSKDTFNEKMHRKLFTCNSMINKRQSMLGKSALVNKSDTKRNGIKIINSKNVSETNNDNCNESSNCAKDNCYHEDKALAIDTHPPKKKRKLLKTQLPFKSTITNTSISNEVKYKNTVFTIKTLKQRPKIFKGIELPHNKSQLIKTKDYSINNNDKDDIIISLINLMDSEFPEEYIDSKDKLPFIKSFNPPKMHQSLINRLNNYKRQSYSLNRLNQEELTSSLEEVFARNLENNGENVIANRIKRYDFNKKSVGYACLKKSSFNNHKTTGSRVNKSFK